jgi:hypothetical protein
VQESQLSPAFGQEFVFLMARLSRERASHGSAASAVSEFEAQTEELIRRHAVPDLVAEYVRHVVRSGFEADFDPLDPALASITRQNDESCGSGWTAFAPSAAGAYALCPSQNDSPVELAHFDRSDGRWLVRRWGISGTVDWSALQRKGWKRWRAPSPTPRS